MHSVPHLLDVEKNYDLMNSHLQHLQPSVPLQFLRCQHVSRAVPCGAPLIGVTQLLVAFRVALAPQTRVTEKELV